ncbi:DEAD/DEAH box helicase family protein [Bifidobacterium sp. ESL0728]|uniref:type ISP restriction/modification enzyme n=1 Tax=Bifidobacterium sp. ESL0728 TaxID=2983220 RepID=UPI0023F6F001|nr:type ISP restriction/modification enzyme [Bifidobacterium sp. ESL0728]WEV58425.1 DEAD/DEAH box helicase family protein [Bifidobacterium sp. ESL0728]
MTTVDEIFEHIVADSADKREQGTRFEYAVKYFLEHDPAWSEEIKQVWMWDEAPTNMPRRQDTGIDLVALDKDGSYWAIQAKCYSNKAKLSNADVSTFFMAAQADERYSHYMIADTAQAYTSNLENFLTLNPRLGAVRIGLDDMRQSNVDWDAFENGTSAKERTIFELRPHQREAVDAVKKELSKADRCSMIMACGTGKTLTSLRLSEELLGNGHTVLFLAPSISLVSQSMRDWVNQVRERINVYVVCSDGKASKLKDESYGQITDIPFPATTNAHTIAERFTKKDDALNVIFSTYQSIQVIHDAQEEGLPDFDLTICDEAHRTTGVVDGEGAFQKVHDNNFIHSSKRLYMTATPRIFSEGAKNKANQGAIEIASMDDESKYGKVAYRLSFGKAVDEGLLTDYKIVIMQVTEDMMGKPIQDAYSDENSEVQLPDAMKFVGCWKALFDRRHARAIDQPSNGGRHSVSFETDDTKRVLHHAIAFAPSIKASKALTNNFRAVIDKYTSSLPDTEGNESTLEAGHDVHVQFDHVDGTMDAATRHTKLDWLAADTEPNECHVLSNARCLAEGVDVPDLDAVMYLSARSSKIDIIQSVGRVMRKSPGKEYGYIIIPVAVKPGTDPSMALSSDSYKIVWDVVRALRSHDERLDAIINAAALGDADSLSKIVEVEVLDESKLKKRKPKKPEGTHIGDPDPDEHTDGGSDDGEYGTGEDYGSGSATQPELDLEMTELAKGINAQIVRKCGTKIYWGEWTDDIADITRHRAAQIAELVDSDKAHGPFMEFVQGLRDSLNSGYSETDAIAVLAQHEVTKPIFETLFTNREVLEGNPIVQGLDRALDSLYEAGLPQDIDNPTLRDLYASVQLSASQLESDDAKQNLIKEIYNEFFTKAFRETADSLGIVYTPVEVVDAQLHMVQRALEQEFHQSLGTRGVHILDGFAGTGTYLCRLIEDKSLIKDEDLPYKYEHDLHSNEIVPLAATIMDINIEQSYHKRMGGDYKPFPGALLTDTFQMYEQDDPLDLGVFKENTERVKAQKELPIKVIIGNPPYRAGDSQNTGNQNTKYPGLDKRVEETYVANSDATLNNSLYDHYIRAFRWASDRIGDSGIVCFVSNGGWLNSTSGAGIRRCFSKEFSDIYVYNLRGNQRTQGEESRKEGGKIFDSGSRATIAITLLVKNSRSANSGKIHYRDIGDYLSRDQKLSILKEVVRESPDWDESLYQDCFGDWLNHRDTSYGRFIPLGIQEGTKKLPSGLFSIWSAGIQTQRDAWAYNFSGTQLTDNMAKTIQFFNQELGRYNDSDFSGNSRDFVVTDNRKISWSDFLYSRINRNKPIMVNDEAKRVIQYRPFCKEMGWFDSQINDRPGNQKMLFPTELNKNIVIDVGERGVSISSVVPDREFEHHGQCFPMYWYEQPKNENMLDLSENKHVDKQGYVKHSAITNVSLQIFQEAYPHLHIDKEDVFYYVYGILNSPEYGQRFGNNLNRELPRVPLAKDFKAFMKAGRELAQLHLNYETVDKWAVKETGNSSNPGRTIKMSYPNKVKDPETGKKVKDLTVLKVAENLMIEGIPLRAYDYVVNGKSAIGWLIDRYQITTDKKSGIINDPNDYSDDPRYIVDLVERVVTVSMKTLDIMDSLPPLNELPQPANWPQAWK